MKKLTLIFSAFAILSLASCDATNKDTERTVIDRDTVAVTKEYEVEKKIREVEVDTVTETETVTDVDTLRDDG